MKKFIPSFSIPSLFIFILFLYAGPAAIRPSVVQEISNLEGSIEKE